MRTFWDRCTCCVYGKYQFRNQIECSITSFSHLHRLHVTSLSNIDGVLNITSSCESDDNRRTIQVTSFSDVETLLAHHDCCVFSRVLIETRDSFIKSREWDFPGINFPNHLKDGTDYTHWRLTNAFRLLIMAALCNRGPLYFCPVVSFFYLLLLFFLA